MQVWWMVVLWFFQRMPKQKYYAVSVGRVPGIYLNWNDCKDQVHKYPQALYKSFSNQNDAKHFLDRNQSKASASLHASRKGDQPIERDKTVNSKRKAPPPTTTAPSTARHPAKKRAKPAERPSVVIQFDGGARGNPGVAGAGASITIQGDSSFADERRTIHVRQYVGECATNNEAEYQGLLVALQVVREQYRDGVNRLIIQGDSKLIIEQLKGHYKVKSQNLVGRYQAVRQVLNDLNAGSPPTFEHVYRDQNKVADALANQAMDAKRSWMTTSEDNHEDQQPLESV